MHASCVCHFQLLNIILASCLLFLTAGKSSADDTATHKPVLLMLFVDDSELSETETSLYEELKLYIQTHQVAVEYGFRFTGTTIPQQIEGIRQLEKAQNCDAVIWITPKDSQTVTLQMAVLAKGQFTIRSVDADVDPTQSGELTIAVRELLADIQIPMTPTPVPRQPPKEDGEIKTAGIVPLPPQSKNHPAPKPTRIVLSLDGGI
ncbi:MAG: hypothetical protein JXX14_09455 [Deltaproteobacteria bacterium]|nr:hypothetical protein [Deltaproteobacteria bacterium]